MVQHTVLQAKPAKAVYYLELFPKEKKSCGRVFEWLHIRIQSSGR